MESHSLAMILLNEWMDGISCTHAHMLTCSHVLAHEPTLPQPELFTNADGVAHYRGDPFMIKVRTRTHILILFCFFKMKSTIVCTASLSPTLNHNHNHALAGQGCMRCKHVQGCHCVLKKEANPSQD